MMSYNELIAKIRSNRKIISVLLIIAIIIVILSIGLFLSNKDRPTVLPNFLKYDTKNIFTEGNVSTEDTVSTILFEATDKADAAGAVDVITAFVDNLCQQGYVLISRPKALPVSADDGIKYVWRLKHSGIDIEPIDPAESAAQVNVCLYTYGEIYVFVDSSKGIVMDGYEDEYPSAKAEDSNEKTDTPDKSVSFGNGVLPSPDAYFGGQLARLRDEDGYQVSPSTGKQRIQGWEITFKTDLAGTDAFIGYAELLASGNYGLTVDKSWEATFSDNKRYYYVYECVGNNDPKVSFNNFTDKNNERRGDFILEVSRHGGSGYTMMTLCFDHDYFSFAEGDKVYKGDLKDLSGMSGTGGSNNGNNNNNNDRYNTKTPCGYCNDGKCKKCNGRGYLYSSASKKYDRNCTGVYCNNGKCSRCDGDGWMD